MLSYSAYYHMVTKYIQHLYQRHANLITILVIAKCTMLSFTCNYNYTFKLHTNSKICIWITTFFIFLLQHQYEPGLDERLKAWIANAENAENLQKQLSCCLPSLSSPLKTPCLTSNCPPTTSSLEPTCPSSTTPSCHSVLSLRYQNLLIAILGISQSSSSSSELLILLKNLCLLLVAFSWFTISKSLRHF